ncbi:MAG: AraC family transcriptional regulator [Caldisericia bacterium]
MKNLYRIEQAVEFIEKNLSNPLTLEDIAENSSISMFYLTRLFNQILGEPLMEYVRKRKLTKASRELVGTDKTIIDITFDCGYESQEAFTRAFKKVFKTTPAKYRKNGECVETLERHRLNLMTIISRRRFWMKEPKLMKKGAFTIVGMTYKVRNENGEIPQMWGEYNKRWDEISNKVEGPCYGICDEFVMDNDDPQSGFMSYMAGHEVTKVENLPDNMTSKLIPASNWLVFEHHGKLDTLKNTFHYIYSQYFPESKYEPAGIDIEAYDQRFIPDSDESMFEIWIRVK